MDRITNVINLVNDLTGRLRAYGTAARLLLLRTAHCSTKQIVDYTKLNASIIFANTELFYQGPFVRQCFYMM